jgi:hypothetical protein
MKRFARLRAGGLSFGAAFALGLGCSSSRSRRAGKPAYNGAGMAGDREAIATDFRKALDRAKGHDTPRG